MRNRKKGRKLGRVRNQRKALIAGLVSNLIINEKITTTEAKAKEIKPVIDKVITKAKKSEGDVIKKVAVIRDLRKNLNKEAVKKITGDFLQKFSKRNSGYTRIIKLPNRKSDDARMAVIEFV